MRLEENLLSLGVHAPFLAITDVETNFVSVFGSNYVCVHAVDESLVFTLIETPDGFASAWLKFAVHDQIDASEAQPNQKQQRKKQRLNVVKAYNSNILDSAHSS